MVVVFLKVSDYLSHATETPVLWPPHAKSWLIEKDSDAGRDWGQEEKRGMTEDEMVGWHHWLNGHGFGWTLGVGDGQGGLVCCGSWGRRVGHDWVTELNWTELRRSIVLKPTKKGKWTPDLPILSPQMLLRQHESYLRAYLKQFFNLELHVYKLKICWDFPDSPVVKIPSFHCRGHKLNPWSEN